MFIHETVLRANILVIAFYQLFIVTGIMVSYWCVNAKRH